jgi:hypothetical protein
MKKLKSEGSDYHWLHKKRYPAAIGLMVDYICSLFQHKKPTNSATPETVAKQEAIEKYRAFFPRFLGVYVWHGRETTRTNLQVPTTMLWKAKASSTSIGN